MIKILHINTALESGGAAKVARQLCTYFHSLPNIECIFAYGRKPISSIKYPFKAFYFGSLPETMLHAAIYRFLGIESIGTTFSTRRLIAYIKNQNFDLIHIHNLHGYYIDVFKLVHVLRDLGIPVVWTLHDMWALTGLYAHTSDCIHCLTGDGECHNRYFYPKTYITLFQDYMRQKKQRLFSYSWNPMLVCPSKEMNAHINQTPLKKLNNTIIHNGVDTSLFKPKHDKSELRQKHQIPSDKVIVLFTSTSLRQPYKGIEIIKKLAKQFKGSNVVFLGLGPSSFSAENVVFSHSSDEKTVAELYALSDIYCLPTQAETCPLSILEAMSCGLPILSSYIPALLEMVPSEAGFLIDFNDSDAFLKYLTQLIQDQPLCQRMGKAARDYVVDSYPIDLFYQKYRSVYHQLDNDI